MNNVILVAIGGALGASSRYLSGRAIMHLLGPGFPWGTLFVNVFGGLLMGLLVGLMAFKISGGENLRLFMAVGFLGGFTTFSAFSLEMIKMIETKAFAQAGMYLGASVLFSLAAVMLGLMIARKIFAP